MRGTTIHLRPKALAANLAVARRVAGTAKLIAMVKADGYGHGAPLVADAFASADWLGVAVVDEAIRLRAAGINTPLLVAEGLLDEEEVARLSDLGSIACVIHAPWQVDLLECLPENQSIEVWLKFDSGMHRLGMQESMLRRQLQRLSAIPRVRVTTLMTHLACADQADDSLSGQQIEAVQQLASELELEVSIANSAALLRYADASANWVRPGIMLYGGSPVSEVSAASLGLQPTMAFCARLLSINDVAKGERVGYGSRWQAQRVSRIGVATVGYGDGYPRAAADGTPVAVKTDAGVFIAPLAGRVSMDMITLDLTDIPSARVGDEVELWGDHVAVDDVAKQCDTISYELFCRLTSRPKRLIDNQDGTTTQQSVTRREN